MAYTLTSIFVLRHYQVYIEAVVAYFSCESTGTRICDRSEFENASYFVVALIVLGLVTSLYPLVAFVFAVNFRDLKKVMKRESSTNQT